MVKCKLTNEKINSAQQTQKLPMVRCGPHDLEVTNLKVVSNELQITYFNS